MSWLLTLVVGAIVLPCGLGAIALAETSGGNTVGGNAFSWMNVRDSSGVNMSSYMFVTDFGSVLRLDHYGLGIILTLLFAAWMAVAITGIWGTGEVLDFGWMNLISTPLRGMAKAFATQLGTSVVLITAATLGAFCVAWFTMRGLHAKAAMQIAFMIIVAILGPFFLSDPLAEVLSSDGLLVQGRDVGLSVAAGINGDSHPQPTRLVQNLQSQMADNFGRKPLQVWNFGHVVDDRPACRSMWSAGMMSGSQDRVRQGMRDCGDAAAAEASNNPSAGQLASGLLLLVCSGLLLAFSVRLAIKIVRSALDSVYYGLMTVFGFAAGGFVYGPTQTFLIRSLVHGFFAAVRMAAEIVFLTLYLMLLGSLFEQARGQVMAVFVIGAIVEVVALSQLKSFVEGFDRGNDWVANRFAVAVQSAGGGGGSGGAALGMGIHAGHNHLGMLGKMSAITTVATFPATEWLMHKTRNFLKPDALRDDRFNRVMWGNNDFLIGEARRGGRAHGGINTVRGAAAAILYATTAGAGVHQLSGVLRVAGVRDRDIRARAINSYSEIAANAGDTPFGRTAAAARRAQGNMNLLIRGRGGAGVEADLAADLGNLQMSAYDFRRRYDNGVNLHGDRHTFVQDYIRTGSRDYLIALGHRAAGTTTLPVDATNGVRTQFNRLDGVDRAGALQIWNAIGNQHATDLSDAVNSLIQRPMDTDRMHAVNRSLARAQQTDQWTPDELASPWKTLVDGLDDQLAGQDALTRVGARLNRR
ncbi:hypothetical protein [Nocardia tengchongensis]|uniref:hypothetical protein n=1 Tax=Nocardia tengchongensis TaxID=2055889 RepID=UPI0036BC19BC